MLVRQDAPPTTNHDVLVLGTGLAGMSAALAAREAGADTFVSGSAIFGSSDYAATIKAMREQIEIGRKSI